MDNIIDEVQGLYQIIEFKTFRKTKGVTFDLIPLDSISHIDSLDRVLHRGNAVSPEPVGDVEQPWYMHTHQADNLVVLHGTREVDIYTPDHGKVEHFTVTANSVHKNGQLVFEGGAMLVWPRHVFHRIVSGADVFLCSRGDCQSLCGILVNRGLRALGTVRVDRNWPCCFNRLRIVAHAGPLYGW